MYTHSQEEWCKNSKKQQQQTLNLTALKFMVKFKVWLTHFIQRPWSKYKYTVESKDYNYKSMNCGHWTYVPFITTSWIEDTQGEI